MIDSIQCLFTCGNPNVGQTDEYLADDYNLRATMLGVWASPKKMPGRKSLLVPWSNIKCVRCVEQSAVPPEWCGLVEVEDKGRKK